MNPTIKDVARKAGVSVRTVSRVLNGSESVKEETRERVLRAVERLDFAPNLLARSLVSKESKVLGLIIADITNPFYPGIVRGVEDTAKTHGYSVILCNSDEDPTSELQYLRLLIGKRVDGLILGGSRIADLHIESVVRRGIKIALMNRRIDCPGVGMVLFRDEEKAYEATSHLIALGHKRIAHLGGPLLSRSATARQEGYERALSDHGVDLVRGLILRGGSGISDGERMMGRLLAKRSRPTAVLAQNDLLAIGALNAAASRGLHVPRDLAVVGFDDILLASHVRPQLTTFRLPSYEIGTRLARIVLSLIRGEEDEDMVQYLDPQLVIRQSCGFRGEVHRNGSSAQRSGSRCKRK